MADDEAAAQARADRREAERRDRRSTGKAQPLNADRPVDRAQRRNAKSN
jgi:hypothetical protein